MIVEPLSDRLIIKMDAPPDRSAGGLHVVNTSQPAFETGVVRFVAPDEERLKPGDRVIMPYGHGQVHEIDGEELVGVRRDALWGILE